MMLRAAIRAMVEAARAARLSGAARADCEREAVRYFETAEMLIEPLQPMLIGIGGLSGSGKSTLARHLGPGCCRPPGAVVLRSDLERKGMFGVPDTDRLPRDAYEPEVTAAVYHRLCNKARAALAAGHGVIFDAVFAREDERQALARVAEAVEVPFVGIWLDAPANLLIERVSARIDDASDADAAIVTRQLGYDLGSLDWHRIDASGPFEATLAEALRVLAGETGGH
ncbi:MAG: AAA family ATPase [Hyphomicrobiales bacterium]